ncbi:MAG TPA: hypothetical protein VFP02_12605 [Acidimicrobiales bacterium]|nr:hypothetical protein [Acidimicrobiales bacterium]
MVDHPTEPLWAQESSGITDRSFPTGHGDAVHPSTVTFRQVRALVHVRELEAVIRPQGNRDHDLVAPQPDHPPQLCRGLMGCDGAGDRHRRGHQVMGERPRDAGDRQRLSTEPTPATRVQPMLDHPIGGAEAARLRTGEDSVLRLGMAGDGGIDGEIHDAQDAERV